MPSMTVGGGVGGGAIVRPSTCNTGEHNRKIIVGKGGGGGLP